MYNYLIFKQIDLKPLMYMSDDISNKSHINISMLHDDIIYVAIEGHKYATLHASDYNNQKWFFSTRILHSMHRIKYVFENTISE